MEKSYQHVLENVIKMQTAKKTFKDVKKEENSFNLICYVQCTSQESRHSVEMNMANKKIQHEHT